MRKDLAQKKSAEAPFLLPPKVTVAMIAGISGRRVTMTGRMAIEREGVIGTDTEVEITTAGDAGRCVHSDRRDRIIGVADGRYLDEGISG